MTAMAGRGARVLALTTSSFRVIAKTRKDKCADANQAKVG